MGTPRISVVPKPNRDVAVVDIGTALERPFHRSYRNRQKHSTSFDSSEQIAHVANVPNCHSSAADNERHPCSAPKELSEAVPRQIDRVLQRQSNEQDLMARATPAWRLLALLL